MTRGEVVWDVVGRDWSTDFRFDRQESSSHHITILEGKGKQRGMDKGREEQVGGGPVRLALQTERITN